MKIRLPFVGGELHVKSVRHLKWVEDKRQVPIIIVGRVCISYWNRLAIEREKRYE